MFNGFQRCSNYHKDIKENSFNSFKQQGPLIRGLLRESPLRRRSVERIRRNPLSNVRADAKALPFLCACIIFGQQSSLRESLSEPFLNVRRTLEGYEGYYNISNFRMVEMLNC